MLEVGESTGALPAMLSSVAEFYEEDVQTALAAAMALIEPLILIIMAVFVGGILISLYLPIFTRSEEHTSELQSHLNLVCRLLLEKKKKKIKTCKYTCDR